MAKTTILQLLHSMSVGGAEVLAARLARQLSDRYRFVFACLDNVGELGEQLIGEGFPLTVLNRGDGIDWGCSRRLRKLLKDESVDLIHAHQYTPFCYGAMSRFPGLKCPMLFTEHGRFHPDYPRRKRMIFNRMFLRRDDRVVAVGEAVRQALINNEGISARRVEVIYNGIDLERFGGLDNDARRRTRQELGLDDDEFVAVIVGRLDYLKDHVTAVRTAERLAREGGRFRMLFVGEGPERPKIEQAIAERGLTEQVRLLGTRHDVPQIFNASDVCLLTSISEGIPLTLIEGMAAGLPVVSTDVGGVAEVVQDNETGLLASSGDDDALATLLNRLRNDTPQRQRMGQAGRDRAHDLFAEPMMHDRYCVHFEEMTSHSASKRQPARVAVPSETC